MSRLANSEIEIKIVGESGQISLGKSYAGKVYRVQRSTGGRIVLTAVAMVPENQLWMFNEPHRSRIRRGLAWAARTQPRETDIEGLLKAKSTGEVRTRGRHP